MYIPGAAAPDSRNRDRCDLYGLVDHWSVKKPIDTDLNLTSADLKPLRVTESMMYLGWRFHRSMTRSERN